MDIDVTYLQMTALPPHSVAPPRAGLAVVHARQPALRYYRYLYDAVGRDWQWTRRTSWSDEQLAAEVQHPQVEIHVLMVDGVPAGFAELDARDAAAVELVQFGLMPEFLGQGLGTYFLRWVIEFVFRQQAPRLWLHTCNLDHPKALSKYLAAGFTIYRTEQRPKLG